MAINQTSSGTRLESIGTVKTVIGTVKAIDQSGVERIVQAGDKVYPNETIVTADNALVLIEFSNGRMLDLASSSHIILDSDIFNAADVSHPETLTSEEIQARIAQGEDPTAIAEAPAAGAGAGDEGASSFVVVDFSNAAGNVESGFETQGIPGINPPVIETLHPQVEDDGASAAVVAPANILRDANEIISGVEDTPLKGNVLENTVNPDGTQSASVVSFTWGVSLNTPAGQHAVIEGVGDLVINTDGSFQFTPVENFSGIVPEVSYLVTDGLDEVESTLSIELQPENDPPLARANEFSITEDTVLTLFPNQLLGNDSDPDNDPLEIVSVQTSQGGTVELVEGLVVFTPDENYNGNASFTYTISDGHGETSTATVFINVVPVNDAPNAVNDNVTTTEDTPVTVEVRGNDTDPDGDALTVTSVTNGNNGTVTIDSTTGNPVYTPDPNFTGTDSFTYTVTDGKGGTDTATVTITVGAVNDAPNAVNDNITTTEDTPITVAVRTNDTDPEGDALTVVSVTDGSNGTVTIDPVTNNPIYTPNPDFNGIDSFSYTVSDGNGGTDTATVTVTVGAINDAPDAVNDDVTTSEDTPITVEVRGNDKDPDGDSLTVTSVTNGNNGTVTIDPTTGNPVYTPNPNFTGTDNFSYTVSDGNGGTDTATVTVTVGAINDAPNAVNDNVTTSEETPITVAVRSNDTDPDGDSLTVISVTNGSNGTVTIDPATGNPVYTPNPNFTGTDSFSYTVSDGHGGTDTATVTVTVGGVNDAPSAVNDNVTTSEDTPITIEVLNNDTDPDGDSLTITSVTNGSHGTVIIDLVTGNPVYTPNPNFNGTDNFSYTVSDGNGGTDTATVTVTVGAINDAPNAVNDNVTTSEDTPITVTVRSNDTDPDGDSLTVTSIMQGSNGVVTIDPVTGNPVYTPNPNFTGTDSFSYTVTDGNGGTDTAIVTVTVGATNDAPNAVNDNVTTSEDTPITVAVRSNDSDPDGDILTVISVTNGSNGTVTIDPVTGNPVYTPNPNFTGTDSFSYTVSDGNGGTDAATVTVTVAATNDAPNAVNDNVATTEDTPITVAVRSNDTDPDGDTLTVTSVTQGSNGTVIIDPITGNPIYTPNSNFNGTDSFSYTVSDGSGGTDTATVTVTVGAVNDAPETNNVSASGDEDSSIPVALSGSDVDGSVDHFVITTLPANGTLMLDGVALVVGSTIPATGNGATVTFSPDANWNGEAQFQYQSVDNAGAIDATPATASITVGSINDAPVANNMTASGNEDSTGIPVVLSGSDMDGNVDHFVITSLPAHGTLYIDNGISKVAVTNGMEISASDASKLSFAPDQDWSGTTSFNLEAVDNQGGHSDSTTGTILVNPVTDTPVVDLTLTPHTSFNVFAADLFSVLSSSADNVGRPSGFTVTAYDHSGNPGVISVFDPTGVTGVSGFGVAGEVPGNDSIGGPEISGNEKIVIELDVPATSVSYQLGFLRGSDKNGGANGMEYANVTVHYSDGTSETRIISGDETKVLINGTLQSDKVSPVFTADAPEGKTITSIEFQADHDNGISIKNDFLVHSITYEATTTLYTVDIKATPVDIDHSETIIKLTLTANEGVEISGAKLLGTADGMSTWEIMLDGSNLPAGAHVTVDANTGEVDVSGLTLTVPAGMTDLTVTATAEARDGSAATASAGDTIAAQIGTVGNDTLIASTGNDILTGGDGADMFVWQSTNIGTASATSADTLTDFNAAEGDTINLNDVLTSGGGLTMSAVESADGHLQLKFTSSDSGKIVQTIDLANVAVNGAAPTVLMNTLLQDGAILKD